MNILSIESSAVAASCAVFCDGRPVAEEFTQNGLTHSVTLLPAVEEALKKAGLLLSDMDAFAVTTGPGSFSGLRIGVTLAKTLAYACGKMVFGVSTLQAIACNLPFADRLVCPIMDARRDQVYTALYRWESDRPCEQMSPCAISAEQLVSVINEPVIFIGDGVPRFQTYLKDALGHKAQFAPPHLCMARASSAAYLSQFETPQKPEDLNPCYLRLSQAEREYNEKHKEKE